MAKRWFPGHYLHAFTNAPREIFNAGEANIIASSADWAGYMCKVWWSVTETSFGVYDFSALTTALNHAQANGKKVIFRIWERSFQYPNDPKATPDYLDFAPYGTFQNNQGTERMYAAKLWEQATGERYIKWVEAMIDATDGHPACQGYTTEEYQIQGDWQQPGFTPQQMDNFWAEVARRASAKCVNTLFHINTGWSYSRSQAVLEPIADYFVSLGIGLGPTDLSYSGTYPYASRVTDFGKFIFDVYDGVAFFLMHYEWGNYDAPESPTFLIQWAHDDVKCNFIGHDPDRNNKNIYGGSYDFNDTLAAVDALNGLIASAVPSSVSAATGGDPVTIVTPPYPNFDLKVDGAYTNFGLKNWGASAAPSWSPFTVPTAINGVAFSYQFQASGSGAITYSLQSGALPAGLSLSSAGVLSGTPTSGETSTPVTVRASNGVGSPADVVVTVGVAVQPNITTTELPGAVFEVLYQQALAAAGTSPLVWSITAGALPGGLALTSAGEIVGTPTVSSGTFAFTVQASNGYGVADTQALSITVGGASAPADITTLTLPAATLSVAYSQAVAATGTSPITWAVVSGALPDGLSLNTGTGIIAGTPTREATFSFSVRAFNRFGNSEVQYSITVSQTVRPASPWASKLMT